MSGVFRHPYIAPTAPQATAAGTFPRGNAVEPPVVVTPTVPTDIRAAYGLSYAGGRVMATKAYKPRKLSKEDIKKLMSIGFKVGKASQEHKRQQQAASMMPHINAMMKKKAA